MNVLIVYSFWTTVLIYSAYCGPNDDIYQHYGPNDGISQHCDIYDGISRTPSSRYPRPRRSPRPFRPAGGARGVAMPCSRVGWHA